MSADASGITLDLLFGMLAACAMTLALFATAACVVLIMAWMDAGVRRIQRAAPESEEETR